MAKTNSTIDFTATIKAAELAAIIVPTGKQLSPERVELLERFDELSETEPALYYKVESGKSAEETKASINGFLGRQVENAKVYLAKNTSDYIIVERTISKAAKK